MCGCVVCVGKSSLSLYPALRLGNFLQAAAKGGALTCYAEAGAARDCVVVGGEGVFVTLGSNNVENKRDDEPQTHKEYIYICKKEEAFFFHTTQVPSPVQSNATQEKRNSIEFGEL